MVFPACITLECTLTMVPTGIARRKDMFKDLETPPRKNQNPGFDMGANAMLVHISELSLTILQFMGGKEGLYQIKVQQRHPA
jgi:hypothetical protein